MGNINDWYKKRRQKEISTMLSNDLLSKQGRGYDYLHKNNVGYVSLSKRWKDLYKRATDYYNNEAHKGFFDTYSGTRDKQGYVSDTKRWYSDLESQRDAANEGVDELLKELDQYSRYYNEDAVKYVRGLITERQNAYNDALKDAGAFRDHWSQWETEDAYNTYLWENDLAKVYDAGDYDAAEAMLKERASNLFSKAGDNIFTLTASDEYRKLMEYEEAIKQGREAQKQQAENEAKKAEYEAYDVDAGQAEIDRLKEFSVRAQAINDELNQVRSSINSARSRGQNADSLLARERALNVQLYQLSEEYRGKGSSAENSFIRNDGASGNGLPSGMGLNVGNGVVEMGELVDFDALLKAKEQEKDSWFSASALWDDGYQPFDVIKTIGATAQDIGEAVGSGLIGIGETALDGLMWLGAAMNQGTMSQAAQDEMIYNAAKSLVTGEKVENGVNTLSRYQAYQDQVEQGAEDFIKQDLYDEEAISHAIFSEHNPISYDRVFNRGAEADSVSGSKLDSIAQSGGQMLGTAALQAAGVPWYVTTFATSFGSEAENALNNGASFSEAGLSATISASAEVLTEKIGGINFKGQTLSDLAVKKFSSVCANKIAQFAFDAGLDIAGEGLEEVLSGYASAIGQKLTYMSDEELNELFSSEDALDAFIGGAIMGGVSSVGDAVKMFKNKDTTSIELGTAASRVVRTDADITLGTKIADFISSVINMQDRSKISKRKLNLGGITKAHQTTVDSVMKTVDSDFSSEGYELWMDGTSAEHIVKRHGEKGEADNSMATREAQELIALTVNDPDAAILIKDEAGNLKLSNRYFNADGSKAPQIRLERVLDDGTVYVSECIPDSVNKRIYITSAYIKKGSTDQLLNMDSEGSPQPTPEASFDGSATNSSISQDGGDVNSKISTDLSRYAELAGMGENGVQLMQEVYDGKMSPEKFFEAYNAIYAAGKRGGDVRNRYVSLLGENVAAIARNAGQMDALKGGKSATAYKAGERAAKAQSTENSPEVLQNGAESGTINKNGKEAQNEQGIHLRDSGEWYDGQNTQGQVSAVEGWTGEAEEQGSGSSQEARTARIGAYVQVEGLEKVSTKSIGVSSGTDKASVVVIPESEYDDGMRQIVEDQAAQGRDVVFVSGSLEIIEKGEAVEARGLISEDGKTMWIQADSDVSAEQISLHEEYHAKVKADPSLLNRMKKKIKKKYKGKLGVLTKMYAALYFTDETGKVTVSADYIFEEICADAYAGIDVLESFDGAEIRATDFQETMREGAKGRESTRAPPSSSEVKASRATKDIYTATSDFARDVVKEDRSAFTSHLLSQTRGMKPGDVKGIQIFGAKRIYFFLATGEMTGKVYKSVSNKRLNLYKKICEEFFNGIEQSGEGPALWAEFDSLKEGGDISDTSLSGYGRPTDGNDTISEKSSPSNSARSDERSGGYTYSTQEIDAILQPLKDMYGVDDSGIKASRTSKSAEEIAKAYLDAVPKRMILANALESIVSSDEDKRKLRLYKHKIKELDAMETELSEVNAKIRELSFAPGPRDKVTLTELKKRKDELESRISRYDSSIIRLEASEPLQKVLRLTKKQAVAKVKAEAKVKLDAQREKAREALDKQAKRYQESKRKSTEGRHKTEVRHKIKKVVAELDKLLRHGNKKNNVKIGLQDAVAAALEAFDVNSDSTERYAKAIADLDARIAAATDPVEIEALTALREKKQRNSERLADKLQAMKKAYEDIHNGRDGENYPGYYKAEAEVIENRIAEVIEKVGNTPIGEMSLEQLEAVYDMYRMVLTTVQNANKLFKDGKLEDLTENATAMTAELQKIKKLPEERLKAGDDARGFVWNELTPYYAFKRVGSDTLMSYYDELVRGQDVYARDLDEAHDFAAKTRKKHGYGKWKLDEIHSFRDKDGKKFDLTLKHMMSIYAYSKREQALDHMEKGGFFFNNKETFKTDKTGILQFIASNESGYKVDARVFAKIKNSLSAEQIAYVDEMQAYLTKMGEKGNEVTRVMWGIDIFKEKVYFPLKSKEDFIYQANTPAETSSLKNDGMTKETKPHASNPIVLESFDEVWANHVEKMSKYHGFVVPIDNLNKLINYGTWMEGDAQVNTVDLSADTELSALVEGVYGSAKYKKIAQYILDVLGKKEISLSDGRLAIVDNSDALHIANRAAPRKTAKIAKINEIIQKARIYAQDLNVSHNKFDSFYYYETTVKFGEEIFPVYLNVGKAKNDGKYHIYDITNKIRDTADRINGLERPKPNEGYALKNGISNKSISQDGENVNNKISTNSEMGSHSISTMLEARFGSGANDYLTTFIKDLNGAKADKGGFFGIAANLLTKFKKTAVAASLSVVVQQPTAIIRATSEINVKYFAHLPKIESLNKKWEQIQKYAPIAIIKDIGGFDAGSGRQIAEWLNADTRRGVKKALNKVDDITMYGAALGDRVGWGAIWSAVGREVQAKQHLQYGTEEFWQACGKRFTEVIVKTQVYDSTLSRSGFMRSKDSLMKMATSFMGEPTLSINMLADTVLQAKRGKIKKGKVVRTVAAVFTSTVAASIVKSFIYALRDEDEDEAYMEKYLQALGGSMLSDANPLNMLPVLRDVISILDGWDIERTDMAIIQDIYNAATALNSENKTTYRKIEDFAGAIAALAGVPLKNLMRTGREIYNVINDAFDGIEGGDLGGAFLEGLSDTVPFNFFDTGWKKTKSQTLYEALIGEDPERIYAIKNDYKTADAYAAAVRKALREHDPRIKKAAQALYSGDLITRNELLYEIVGEGVFDEETVAKAIDAEADKIEADAKAAEKPESDVPWYDREYDDETPVAGSIYSASDINTAFDYCSDELALEIIAEITELKVEEKVTIAKAKAESNGEAFDEGKARAEAEDSVRSTLRSTVTKHYKPLYREAYVKGDHNEMDRIKDILKTSGLYVYKTKRDVDDVLREWLEEE